MFIAVSSAGGVAERSNAAVLKTAEVARLPWVRIPPPPHLVSGFRSNLRRGSPTHASRVAPYHYLTTTRPAGAGIRVTNSVLGAGPIRVCAQMGIAPADT